MLFALLYAVLRRMIGSGHPSVDRELEIEVVVLRHQVKVLSRKVGRPKLRRIDKAFLAACSRVLPRHRWRSFIVAPSTLLRWHRELVRRKWTYKPKRLGRPPIAPALSALICRMARENPRWGYMRIKGECRKLGVSVAATTVKRSFGPRGSSPHPAGRPELERVPEISGGRDFGMRPFHGRDRVLVHALRALLHRGRDQAPPRHHLDSQPFRSSSRNKRGTLRWMVNS
jgi:hypothetical protein